MRRAYKFRMWTNANQERELATMLETHRRLYNAALAKRKESWDKEKKTLTSIDLYPWFVEQRESNPFYQRLNGQSVQQTLHRLDRSFENFFRRIKEGAAKPGYPRFKGRDRFDSFTFASHGNGVKLAGNKLRVQHIGTIRVKVHREIEGKIKTVSIKREAGKWYVILSCDLGDIKVEPSLLPPIGIDVGLESFLTTSERDSEPNPRYLKEALPKLRIAGRNVSRKKKGGKNRRKSVKKLQKVHARVKNKRREHHHQTALRLIRRAGMIAVESLNINNMLKNHRMARSISDAGWSSFIGILRNKAERAGVQVVEVDPRGTSQNCSGCNQEVKKDLKIRIHKCPHCGLVLHRDHNAARNILARAGVTARTGPAEANVAQQSKRSPRSLSTPTGICQKKRGRSNGAKKPVTARKSQVGVQLEFLW